MPPWGVPRARRDLNSGRKACHHLRAVAWSTPRTTVTPNPARQPVFNIPPALLAVLGVLLAIQGLRVMLPEVTDAELLARFAFVPGRFTMAWNPAGVLAHYAALGAGPEAVRQEQVARFFLGDGSLQPWTVLTYALLHGSWSHVGLNCVWLLAFGAPVARRFGSLRFLVFFGAAAVAGVAAHYVVYPDDLQPLVGASASVSGCMAAALRFMFHTERPDPSRAPVPLHSRPAVSIPAMFRDRRAVSFLLVWFITNLATGVGAVASGLSEAPIAWQAHIGGFLFGLLSFSWFDPTPRSGAADQAHGSEEPGRAG
jgi:membrane associated rhomboid family serine protease